MFLVVLSLIVTWVSLHNVYMRADESATGECPCCPSSSGKPIAACAALAGACDRNHYRFLLSTEDRSLYLRRRMEAMACTSRDVSIVNDTIWYTVAKDCAATFVLLEHPWLSTFFHNRNDMYTSVQRLGVMFTTLFSSLLANAMFFGQTPTSIESTISISIYSSLVVTPVGIVFPSLFYKAAMLKIRGEKKASFLPGEASRLLLQDTTVLVERQLSLGWVLLLFWVSGATVVTFVYGMQMDLQAPSPGQMAVSAGWLLAIFLGMAQSFLLIGTLVSICLFEFRVSVCNVSVFMFGLSGPLTSVVTLFVTCLQVRYEMLTTVAALPTVDVDGDDTTTRVQLQGQFVLGNVYCPCFVALPIADNVVVGSVGAIFGHSVRLLVHANLHHLSYSQDARARLLARISSMQLPIGWFSVEDEVSAGRFVEYLMVCLL